MPTIHMAPSTSVYDSIMRSAVHQSNGQTLFSCPWHGPATGMSSTVPTNSCEGCWILYLLRLEAVTPPAEREELLYNLNKYMTNVVKLAENGNFDLQIDPHSQVSVDLDPMDFAPQAPKEISHG